MRRRNRVAINLVLGLLPPLGYATLCLLESKQLIKPFSVDLVLYLLIGSLMALIWTNWDLFPATRSQIARATFATGASVGILVALSGIGFISFFMIFGAPP